MINGKRVLAVLIILNLTILLRVLTGAVLKVSKLRNGKLKKTEENMKEKQVKI